MVSNSVVRNCDLKKKKKKKEVGEPPLTCSRIRSLLQEPMKSKAPQLHLEYRFYKLLGTHGEYHFRGITLEISRNKLDEFADTVERKKNVIRERIELFKAKVE